MTLAEVTLVATVVVPRAIIEAVGTSVISGFAAFAYLVLSPTSMGTGDVFKDYLESRSLDHGFEKSKGNNHRNGEVKDAAKAENVDPNDFSNWLHEEKVSDGMGPGDSYTYQQLRQLAKRFKNKGK